MRTENLNDQIALVTGANRGIGRYIAQALHDAGATVGITGRDKQKVQAAAAEIGERCTAFVCDHSDPQSIQSIAREVKSAIGDPDILVNNAGCMRGGRVADMDLDTWNEIIGTNLTGVFLATQAFLPGMIRKNRGDIFMISSMSGKKGDPGGSAYAASKFGLQGFSQALNYEVRGHNIRVMVLNPSQVSKNADSEQYDPSRKGYLHAIDIADTIVHLACLPARTLIRDMDIWGTNPPS
ncbi:SDR family NAD(P)-dependent oxidoreductase [Candidatus Sumerlaeota bacterium]|nr:SDR family NAD(P)-dependent oxidoreductase [Candidatus Sumerlaeota bacterium]